MDSRLPAGLADYSEWQARDYFETYYSEVVLPDEQAVLDYQLRVLRTATQPFARALEYGCGPTLHRAIAMAPYARRIDMADWVADNLVQVREWLRAGDDNADWNRFTRFILERESRLPDAAHVRAREATTREVVQGLFVSDARWDDPLGAQRRSHYDLIVSGFCLDAVSNDKAVWRACMRNVLSMLAPGGTLVMHALHDCLAYKVGDRMFPSAGLTVADMRGALEENGFEPTSIDVIVIPCPDNAVYGYSGILTTSGRRAA